MGGAGHDLAQVGRGDTSDGNLVIGGWVVGDKEAMRLAWLYPLRDLLGFILWVASYTSRRLGWREDRFVLVKGGLMERI